MVQNGISACLCVLDVRSVVTCDKSVPFRYIHITKYVEDVEIHGVWR